MLARLIFSITLILTSYVKLCVESRARDQTPEGRANFFLTDPLTLYSRSAHLIGEGPSQDVRIGQKLLEGMLQTNPASAERWFHLGGVFLESGQFDKGKYCFARAAELAPNIADTWLNLANFYIGQNQPRAALPFLGRILRSTNWSEIVFNDFDRLNLSIREIAEGGGLPAAEPSIAEAYFRHLLEAGDVVRLREAWQWMKTRSPSDPLTQSYVDFLVTKGLVSEAAAAWSFQLGKREPEFGTSTFIINGDFERELEGTLFDWRNAPDPHVQVSRDNSVFLSGQSALRLEFDGKINSAYQGVSQRVFLPRGAYRFEAFVRTAGITTDEGVGLRVLDAQSSHQLLIETERLRGTTDWKKLGGKLIVDSPVRLVEIRVFRRPSWRFDSSIAGTVWIDHVSLKRE